MQKCQLSDNYFDTLCEKNKQTPETKALLLQVDELEHELQFFENSNKKLNAEIIRMQQKLEILATKKAQELETLDAKFRNLSNKMTLMHAAIDAYNSKRSQLGALNDKLLDWIEALGNSYIQQLEQQFSLFKEDYVSFAHKKNI